MRRSGWMVALAALLLPPMVQGGTDDGAEAFATHCAICHNEGGTGTPGLAPPLDRPEFWQALGDDAPTYVGGIVTRGFNMPITVRGERYVGMFMQPVAATDEEIASIVSWLLTELGQMEQTVTPEDIASIKERKLTNADLRAMRPKSE